MRSSLPEISDFPLRGRAGARARDANAFVRYTPIQRLGIELGVRNATDELYAYEQGFYEPGRTWLAQLDYRL